MSTYGVVCEFTGELIPGTFRPEPTVCRCKYTSRGPDYCFLREAAALMRIAAAEAAAETVVSEEK
jgi:hypothetical protein